MTQPNINGFYAGYFSALGGNGIVLFLIKDGNMVGADLTTHFDGKYAWIPDKQSFEGVINVRMKPGVMSVQGVPSGPNGLQYDVSLSLPPNFASLPFVSLGTPIGPVNARFEMIRAI